MCFFRTDTLEVLNVNAAAAALYQYTVDEFCTKTIADLRPDGDIHHFETIVSGHEVGNELYHPTGIFRNKRKDGKIIYVDVSVSRIDKQIRMLTLKDVTGVEMACHKLDCFFNMSIDLLYIADQGDNYRRINNAWAEKLGYTMEELNAMPSVLDIVHPDDKERTASRISSAYKQKETYTTYHNTLRKKDGTKLHVTWNTSFDYLHGLIISIGRDTTRELNEKEGLYLLSSAVENTSEGIMITSAEKDSHTGKRTIVYVNDALSKLTGYSKSELLDVSPAVFQGEKTSKNVIAKMSKALAAFKPVEAEVINYKKDGTEYWLSLNIVPVFDDEGKCTHFVSIQKNITNYKLEQIQQQKDNQLLEKKVNQRTEELVRANQELEMFNYAVSHDLRTPIRAIEIYNGIIREELVDSNKGLSDQVQKCIEEMRSLIEDMLEFSRMGKSSLVYEDINMEGLVREVVENQKWIEDVSDTEIVINSCPDVVTDRNLLKVALNNLVSNALKYSKHNASPRVEVDGWSEDDFLYYKITDNGIGFDPKYAESLFKPFIRLHNGESYKGNGAGLAIVEKIIFRLGGKIWAESIPNVGASFYFCIPASPAG